MPNLGDTLAESASDKKTEPTKTASAAKKAAPAKKAQHVKKALAAKALPVKKATTSAGGRVPQPTEKEVSESRAFKRARTRAQRVVKDPDRMRQVAAEASDKSIRGRLGPLDKIFDQVSALIRLVVAYARGHYRDVSNQSLVLIVAGLIYFVSPVDLIPDFLPGGFLDDYAVLLFVLRRVSEELDAFIEWENGKAE
jgi:uncharacterized membrane protein YkvA (DUF1232 family)